MKYSNYIIPRCVIKAVSQYNCSPGDSFSPPQWTLHLRSSAESIKDRCYFDSESFVGQRVACHASVPFKSLPFIFQVIIESSSGIHLLFSLISSSSAPLHNPPGALRNNDYLYCILGVRGSSREATVPTESFQSSPLTIILFLLPHRRRRR